MFLIKNKVATEFFVAILFRFTIDYGGYVKITILPVIFYSFHVSAKRCERFFYSIVASVDMMKTSNHAIALCTQSRNRKRRAAA